MEAEFAGLINSSRGTLSDSEASELLEFIEARDYSLALETLCGILVDRNKRVTPDLYLRIHSLSLRVDGVDPYIVESLRVNIQSD
ncbi:MAG: MafI family immunity protein [Candidatus Dormiibacterota bacterium]